MPTTSIRLDDQLKARIGEAARRAKMSPHNFMLEALAEAVSDEELHEDFERAADEALRQVSRDGKVLDWEETKIWMEARVTGQKAPKPRPRMLPKSKRVFR